MRIRSNAARQWLTNALDEIPLSIYCARLPPYASSGCMSGPLSCYNLRKPDDLSLLRMIADDWSDGDTCIVTDGDSSDCYGVFSRPGPSPGPGEKHAFFWSSVVLTKRQQFAKTVLKQTWSNTIPVLLQAHRASKRRTAKRRVFVDESHPFAGETVEFDIEVIDAPVSCQPLRS